ncbi:xylulose kinase [Raphidocelis subcapitata]|uniref:D-ribulose kinase n=1 Tax=Raphidocelis subcapitata TaxID=307507 RepID=A0A2V0NN43_9CHLO|nr:xylulose kinase [Raphidocelis subcapitata]|eukprot:GBF88954.1 xylulose kinase [Raphidocelis subcapitata]
MPRGARAGGAAAAAAGDGPCHVGLDFGTSGARVTVIDDAGAIVAEARSGYGEGADRDWAGAWERVLFDLLSSLPAPARARAASLAIDGTSATALLVDARSGEVLAPPKLYNEAQGPEAVAAAKAIAPPAHTAVAATSTLCKLLTWRAAGAWSAAERAGGAPALLHQADWLAGLLHGRAGVSDWNNALKLGFDPEAEAYPAWLTDQDFAQLLPPRVVAPGAPVAPLSPAAAARAGLPPGLLVCGGTTDSIAAFVAAGVTEVGQAVTSLGSTMAVKLLSSCRVDDAAFGVYSHRLGDAWLVGGASNTGGAVLRRFFSDAALEQLTPRLNPAAPTGLDYYPLAARGERFPVNDPGLEPRLEPRPADDAVFLQGLLESMARIEGEAYSLLRRLGASPLREVVTAGGGARNEKWTAMRAAALGVPVRAAGRGEASYGAALLARQGWRRARGEGGGGPPAGEARRREAGAV